MKRALIILFYPRTYGVCDSYSVLHENGESLAYYQQGNPYFCESTWMFDLSDFEY